MTDHQPETPAKQLRSSKSDLEVVVGAGDEQVVFKCHSVILASYSDYIDRMLSTSMSEQQTGIITFPDIQPDVWTKLVAFLEPGGSSEMDLEDIDEVLPIYDKYTFQGGIKMCDNKLFNLLKRLRTNCHGADSIAVAKSAVLCYNLNLEMSKSEAIEFAAYCLKAPNAHNEEEETIIRLLLPLIQDDEPTLKFITSTVMGKDENMSMDAMRGEILEDSFVVAYMLRFEQITFQTDIIRKLEIKQIHLSDAGSERVNGEYLNGYPDSYREGCGALQIYYVKFEGLIKIVIEAADPFGKTWQIVEEVNDPLDDTEGAKRTVLYTWKSDFNSLVLPRKGWRAEGGDDRVPSIKYNFARY